MARGAIPCKNDAMNYTRLGKTGLKVSRICLGCMSYGVPDRGPHPVVAAGRRSAAVHQAGARRRHQLLRYGQRLLRRHQRRNRRQAAQRFCHARRDRARHESSRPHAARCQRRRPLAQSDPHRNRSQPPPPRHRLRRPLPNPSLGLRHADRRNARGAARRRESRQGPLHRREQHVCLAIRQSTLSGRPQRLDAVRLDAEPLQPHVPRGRARNDAALPGRRRSA